MPYLLRTLACIWLLLRVMLTESFVGRISFSFRFPQYFTTAIFTGAVQVTIRGLWGNCDVFETGAIFKLNIYQTWCNVIFHRIIFFKYSILYDRSVFENVHPEHTKWWRWLFRVSKMVNSIYVQNTNITENTNLHKSNITFVVRDTRNIKTQYMFAMTRL